MKKYRPFYKPENDEQRRAVEADIARLKSGKLQCQAVRNTYFCLHARGHEGKHMDAEGREWE